MSAAQIMPAMCLLPAVIAGQSSLDAYRHLPWYDQSAQNIIANIAATLHVTTYQYAAAENAAWSFDIGGISLQRPDGALTFKLSSGPHVRECGGQSLTVLCHYCQTVLM